MTDPRPDAPRPAPFDPRDHRIQDTRWFEDYDLGEIHRMPSRTMTDALFAAFQLASGDNHPIHYDRRYCQALGHRDMLAHGYQVAIQTCVGAGPLAHMMGDALIGFLEQSSKFLHPVYAGDTLYPEARIAELTPQRTTGVMRCEVSVRNQDGVLVLEGEHKYLLRRRPTPDVAS